MSFEVLDVSNNQGIVDWYTCARSGQVAAAIDKASEGVTFDDGTFVANITSARRTGLRVGAYHFARPVNNTPDKEAAHFLRQLDGVGGPAGIVCVLDIENTDAHGSEAAWALRWLQIVEQATGRPPMLYTYGGWWQQHGSPDVTFARYPLWLAAYQSSMPAAPRPWPRVHMWQHTSGGACPGASGRVDLSTFFGSTDDWDRLAGIAPTVPKPAQPLQEDDMHLGDPFDIPTDASGVGKADTLLPNGSVLDFVAVAETSPVLAPHAAFIENPFDGLITVTVAGGRPNSVVHVRPLMRG